MCHGVIAMEYPDFLNHLIKEYEVEKSNYNFIDTIRLEDEICHATADIREKLGVDYLSCCIVLNYKNIDFRVEDILDLHEIAKYDLIVSFSCLHYVKYQEMALKKMRYALKPEGRILLMLYRKCPQQWSAIDKIVSNMRWRNYFEHFDPGYYEYLPERYQKLLEQNTLGQFTASFTPVEHIIFESKEKLNKFMRGWLPHLQKIPEEQRDLFMQEIVDAYVDALGLKESQSIKIPFVRLIVY